MNSELFYFDAHTTDFHPGNAYWLCFCAAHIYDEEPVIKKTILEKGMDITAGGYFLSKSLIHSREEGQCSIA